MAYILDHPSKIKIKIKKFPDTSDTKVLDKGLLIRTLTQNFTFNIEEL